MIYFESTKLSPNLYVESVSGLYDFPKAKNSGEDWDNEPFLKFPTSQKKWQFESRKIKLNCFIIGDTFEAAQTEFLTTLGTKLQYDNLKPMTIPAYSNRLYLVEFSKYAIVSTNYDTGVCVLRFTLTFNEPQPFNIQMLFKVDVDTTYNIEIGSITNVGNSASEYQKYINLYTYGQTHEFNIEYENTGYTGTFYAGNEYRFLAYGDIDTLTKISVNVTAEDETIANYYFRNGTIS